MLRTALENSPAAAAKVTAAEPMSLAGLRGAADGPGVREPAVVSPGEALAPVLAVLAAGVHAVMCRCCSMPCGRRW